MLGSLGPCVGVSGSSFTEMSAGFDGELPVSNLHPPVESSCREQMMKLGGLWQSQKLAKASGIPSWAQNIHT